ncbi:SLATT domain-containing protein [Comamonas sp. SY3]|uniref:SLATT domain-containing protein n=1 Tax=Comamonas sp. SY3 TaxID=3243601 RepID=UPI00359326DC
MKNDAICLAETAIDHYKKKANHNKNESLFCFSIIVLFSLLSPMFVMLGKDIIFGKIVPSSLSLMVAASSAWLQLRKPQHLWSIYRDSQRKIEDVLCKYNFFLGDFNVAEAERNRLLAEHTRAINWETHTRWLPLVPSPDLAIKVSTDNKI